MHQNRASPFASDFRCRLRYRREFRSGNQIFPFNRRENRRSLAIFFAEEIAHLGALKIARFCGGAVKIAATTAENRTILVHSDGHQSVIFCNFLVEIPAQGKEKRYTSTSPSLFLKTPCNWENIAGTNESAFFRCRSTCTGGGGGVQNKGRKKAHKLFQHKLSGPNQKTPKLGYPPKVYVPHFLGKNAKKGPT